METFIVTYLFEIEAEDKDILYGEIAAFAEDMDAAHVWVGENLPTLGTNEEVVIDRKE